MNKPLIVENEILLRAPKSKVWDALVNPQQTRKYMFGCEAISDWAVGNPLLWKAEYEGKTRVFVQGRIVAIEPESHLVYTTFDPNNPELEDIPDNYLIVTYRLTEVGESTKLEVSQGDFSAVAQGEKRYEEVYNNGQGWMPVLERIRALVE